MNSTYEDRLRRANATMDALMRSTPLREASDTPNTTRGDKPQPENHDPNAGALPVLGDAVRWSDGTGIVDRITPDGLLRDVANTPVMGTPDDPALRISMIVNGVTHYLAMKASAVTRVQVTGEGAVKAQLRESLVTEMRADLVRFTEAQTASGPRPVVGDTVSFPGGIGMVDQISMDSPLTGSQGKTVSGTTADPALLLHLVRGGMLSSPVQTEAVLSSAVHIIDPRGNQAVSLQEAAVTELKERIARSSERVELGRRAEQAAARARAFYTERAAGCGGTSGRPVIRYDD